MLYIKKLFGHKTLVNAGAKKTIVILVSLFSGGFIPLLATPGATIPTIPLTVVVG